MPYPNEHAARIISPDRFEQDSFRRKKIADGIDIIIGKLKGETTMTTQAYRFDSNKFTASEARKWLKDHKIDYISFEEAAKKSRSMNNIEFKAIDNLEIKADGEDFVIEGWGAIFGNVDSYNDIIEHGAFAKTLSENRDRISLCYQHNISNPIGKINVLEERPRGLWLQSRISDAEPSVKQKIKEGILKEFSIGYSTVKYMMDDTEPMNPIRRLKEVKLWEISLVTIAANPLATLDKIKSEFGIESLEEQFDLIIEKEKDHFKKHELLKLKYIALNQDKSLETLIEEPPKGLTIEDIDYFTKRLTLI